MRTLWMVLLLAGAGCLSTTEQTLENLDGTTSRFIVLGDFGTGEPDQQRVADSMVETCEALGCDFVIATGDNIYEAGVTSPYDPQFEIKFELPYAELDLPFHLVLGNHDNGGTRGLHPSGDLQISYSERTDRLSDNWNLPARWYETVQGDLRFLAMDTNVIWYNNSGATGNTGADLLSQDPDAVAQTAFMQSALATPWDGWTFTFGHHPLYSNGDHGDTGTPTGPWLKQIICESGRVDVSFSGHDHDLQWIKAKDDCGATEFIVSGAGAKTRSLPRDTHDAWFGQGDTLGYFWIEVQGNTLTGKVFDESGRELFERVLVRDA